MQKTIFALLTTKQARSAKVVEASLDQEFTVGAPWFSKPSQIVATVTVVAQ